MLSFHGPFDDYDRTGLKRVIPKYKTFGDTVINENFIRLTPDRQSKRGGLFSDLYTNTPEFEAVFKFRIAGQVNGAGCKSGWAMVGQAAVLFPPSWLTAHHHPQLYSLDALQGRKLYGDGMALWFTKEGVKQWHKGTELHGASSTFTGFGVIFDTFKNSERPHKDGECEVPAKSDHYTVYRLPPSLFAPHAPRLTPHASCPRTVNRHHSLDPCERRYPLGGRDDEHGGGLRRFSSLP